MTSLFDGLSGLINGVFGASHLYVPPGGPSRVIEGVFREGPVEVLSADGVPIIVNQPTLRVPSDVLSTFEEGATVQVADGRSYRLLNRWRASCPAPDAFTIFALELQT